MIPCRAPAAPAAGPRRAAESSRSGIRGPVQGVRADAERRGQPASPRDQGDVRHPARCAPSGPPDLARVKNRGRRRRDRERARRRLRRRATPRPCRTSTKTWTPSRTRRSFLLPEPVPGCPPSAPDLQNSPKSGFRRPPPPIAAHPTRPRD